MANYAGDGTFGASESSPVPITVLPEKSQVATTFFSINNAGRAITFSSGPYGSPVFLRADVIGASGIGTATGNVVFTDNGAQVDGDPVALNSQGNAFTAFAITTFKAGSHRIISNYSGDASFKPGTATPAVFVITQAPTATTLQASSTSIATGGTVALTATVRTNSFGNPPSGRVIFMKGTTAIASIPVTGSSDPNTGLASAVAVFNDKISVAGSDTFTAAYHGDPNYQGSTSSSVTVTVTAP